MGTVEQIIKRSCLIFPFSRTNANAISALLASLDIDPQLQHLRVIIPNLEDDPENIEHDFSMYDKIIVAFSVFTTQLPKISRKIELYKSHFLDKDLLVIAGGPHPIGDPFSMLYNGADIVCTGEGEVVFRDILSHFLQEKPFDQVLGIAYFIDEKQMVQTPKPPAINLSDYPPFSTKHQLIRPIEITRGCAWKCRFCQIRSKGGTPVRHRPINQILEYIKHTVDYFKDRRPDIRFVSPNALSYGSDDGKTLKLEMIKSLLSGIRDIIGEEGKIYFGSFPSEVRPETITEESSVVLKNYSDSITIILGGQSGSDRILIASDRGHDVKETERATELLVKAGFEVDVDIIMGLPGETEEDIDLTITHMQNLFNLGARIHSHTFMPLVGTPYASEDPGKIHPKYSVFIDNLQERTLIRGRHVKQQRDALIMSQRRKNEKSEKSKFKRIRLK